MTTRTRTSARFLSLALVTSLAGLLFAGSATAQTDPATTGRHGRHTLLGFHPRHAVKRQALAEKLGLSKAQREQLHATVDAHKPAMEQARQAMQAVTDTLRAALAAQPRDAATVAAAHVAMDQARDAAKAAREARRSEMGAALTPEQRAEFEAALQARKDSHK